MKISSFLLITAAMFWLPQNIFAQSPGIKLVPDDTCFVFGQAGVFNVTDNDMLPPTGGYQIVPVGNYPPCFQLDMQGTGRLQYKPSPECPCRTEPYVFEYGVQEGGAGSIPFDTTTVTITIKCPKPDCALVELEIPETGGAHNPVDPKCIDACENAKVTYFLPYDTSKDYTWTATGGTVLAMNGGNEASVMVAWGNQGVGSITVVISSGGTVLQTITFCINILEGPTAIWTSPDKSICKGQSVSFVNTTLNANSYFWDFGDGSIPSTAQDPPPHTYNNPGIYTVCLIATKDNYDQDGKALCCCSDTMCMDITVDSLPGPKIFCLSTLCAHDESDYWTDAVGCATYDWTVLDENGNPWPFTGDGTPMIHVIWGNGPTGTVMLEVTGCNTPYCANPSSITVPIIPANAPVSGITVVCPGESATYSVQKWAGTDYVWKIVPNDPLNPTGVILSGQGTNTVVVQWFASGMLMVNYTNSFLSGLPDQNPLDCEGVGSLNVVVKPRFFISGPTTVCLHSTSSLSAFPADNYTWTITPAETFTVSGNTITVANWSTPGPHVVTAVPFNAAAYCNAQATTVVQVIQVPKADSITGPKVVCLNQPYTYVGYASQPGLNMIWSAVGGTVTPTVGSSVSVTWTSATGPYYIILSLQGTTAPFCISDTIRCEVKPRKLLPLTSIVGNGTCPSGQGTYYSLPTGQPAGTVYNWTISPASLGSVVGGQGTYSVTVQWNNVTTTTTATLMVSASLCGTTYSHTQTFTLQPVPLLTIFSVLNNCTYMLTASGGTPPYNWSTGAMNTAGITVTTPGTYTVTSTVNGCSSSGAIQVGPLPLPTASISTGDPTILCVSPTAPPAIVTLQAVNGLGYSFQWYCNINGGGYNTAGTGSSLVHSNSTPPTNVVGTFLYYVVVTAQNGCSATSNIITIFQSDCDPVTGGGGGCTPDPAASFAATVLPYTTPNCNDRTFHIAQNLATNISWNFGDPNSNTYTGTVLDPTHSYTNIGCRLVSVSGLVPNVAHDGFCLVTATIPNVCIPIIANFSFGPPNCAKQVTFTDQTTYMTADGPPVAWSWNFDGTGTSTAANPTHTFPSSGTYNVTLTVTNAAGCQSTKILPVTIPPMVMPTIGLSASSPYCVGEPIQFTGGGTGGITTWLWEFVSTTPPSYVSNTSQNPAQSFNAATTYTVTLTGTNALGCTGTATAPFTVVLNPVPGIISSPDTDLCQGQTATLTATSATATMWTWSNGATTQTITVSTAGTYTVIVKDANGCTATPAPITVIVRPLPPAIVSGNPIICGPGCTTLSAPTSNPNYTYEWQTGAGAALSPPNAASSLQVCTNGTPYPLGTYQVVVTDVNGCSATSPDITVVAKVPPNFSITASPSPCEGIPVTLTLAPVQPDVVYSWSNGGTGSSTVVTQAGSYQAVGVDTMTGCSFTASIIIHPKPDLCIVPTGCYKVCDPDTICGPDGLAAYQWNLNGVPITGANSQCLIVTQMGTYSLTGTTSFGCTATSDSLILMVMPCDPVCDSISAYVDAAVDPNGNERPCCFNIVIDNMKPNFFTGVNISVLSGGTLPIGNVTAGAGWMTGAFVSGTSVTMEPSVGTYLPIGGGTCAQICLVPTASTQQVLVEFLDADGVTLCDTILTLECENCMTIEQETFICDPATGIQQMKFCVHNANTNTFNANALVLMGPPGVTFSPASFSLPNIPPGGTYCYLTTTITAASSVDLNNLCIGFTIHQQDVTTGLPPKECCMVKECYDLPDCCPHFATATAVDTMDGKCCWKITLNQPAGTSQSVLTNIILPSGVTFDGVLPPTSAWTINYNSPQSITWVPNPIAMLPAVVTLPTVCFDVPYGSPVPQLLEILWSAPGNILCADTLEFFCQPDTDCVAMTPLTLTCDPVTGDNIYTVVVTNPFNTTSTVIPNHVAVVDVSPSTALVGNGVYPIGDLMPGNSVTVPIHFNGPPGMVVCFRLNMYRKTEPNIFEECCVTEDSFCVTLKDCSLIPRQEGIAIFPNPTRGNFTLAFGETGSPVLGRVVVRDVMGRLIREEDVPPGLLKHELLLLDLTSGLYFVEFVEDQARVWTGKLSVIR